ncbi:MAG: hypothetical protein KDD69_17380 [Bdellovibrionales bacterium]|nr:hypothetical protein [Bdellovibrionales bacterium]
MLLTKTIGIAPSFLKVVSCSSKTAETLTIWSIMRARLRQSPSPQLARAQLIGAALLGFLVVPTAAVAQNATAITLGVQEIYDDNIFLENDRRRPAPLVQDDALEEDISDGDLSVFYSDQADGDPDADLLTNVFLGAATTFPQVENYADIKLEGQVGGLFFADYSDQNRLTLDGTFNATVSELVIPRPFYFDLRSELSSHSDDISVAEGTGTRASETLDNAVSFGLRDWELGQRTRLGLNYTGAYHLFLGEFLFSEKDDYRYEEQGADYHTHTLGSSLEYDLSQTVLVGVKGSAGVQLFTDVQRNDGLSKIPLEDEANFDRTNGDMDVYLKYNPTQQLFVSLSAGLQVTSFHNDPEPFEETIIDPKGNPQIILVERDDSEASLVYQGDVEYVFEPGAAALLGARQEVGTDIDGDRITVRSTYINLTKSFGDRFKLDGGVTFVQFSEENELSESVDRAEFSTSASYQLTQSTALTLGYNYITQDSSDTELEENLRFRSRDYEVNRVFLALNVGFLGLPL